MSGLFSTPKPPDPKATAAAQTGTNVATALANARLNMVDQVGPNGSKTYQTLGYETVRDPASGASYQVPRYQETTALTPTAARANASNQRTQEILARTGTSVAGNLEGHLGTQLSLDGLPGGGRASSIRAAGQGLAMGYGDPEGYADQRQRVEEALMSRLSPALDRDRETLRTSLVNQGVGEGTEAFDRAMNRFGEQANDARMGAILGAGEEQTRLAALDRDRAAFGNMAVGQRVNQATGAFSAAEAERARALGERTMLRNQPINEVAAMLSGGQIAMPMFGAAPQLGAIPTTDYAGLVNANYAGRLQADSQRKAMMGSLFGLGGDLSAAGIAASDRRLKTDVERIGTYRGIGLYAFRYVWGGARRIGLMAQEVMRIAPEAVLRHPSGFLMVDYGRV